MFARRPLLLALVLGLSPSAAARAGETACWFENGAVVIPAEVGGIAGDWLLDPSAPATLLHETRALMEGLPSAFEAHGRLAGQPLERVAVTVADLDDRAPGFPTPIVGVIGADALAGLTVDLTFAPCRIAVTRGRRPSLPGARSLRLRMAAGVPALEAAVADDHRARKGVFAIDWGSRAAVRLMDAVLSPAPVDPAPTPRNLAPARLRALSLGGALVEEPSTAIAAGLDPALGGTLGTDLWSRWRLRLDMPRGRLQLAPK